MPDTSVEARVRRIIGLVLQQRFEDGQSVHRDNEPRWDSLKHLEILFAIEEAFSVRFAAAELSGLNSSDAIVQALERMLAA